MTLIYLVNLLVAFDETVNTILLGAPEDSISGRLGRAMASGKPKFFVPPIARSVDWVALHVFGQSNHCQSSIIEPEDGLNRELWSWSKP